jgi:hypothetical protein
LNLDLIELCLVGRKTKQGAFRIGFLSDLNALRARRDWLAESSIANFYGSQSGPRLH